MDDERFDDHECDDIPEDADDYQSGYDDGYHAAINAGRVAETAAFRGEPIISITANCVADTTPAKLIRELQRFAAMLRGPRAEEMLACLDPDDDALAHEVKTRDGRAAFCIIAKFTNHGRRLTEQDLISAEKAKVGTRQRWTGGFRGRESDDLS
jgi:hypothetical protein